MDNSLSYADILTKTLQQATRAQPRLQAIQLYPVCDVDSGHFLILATGWDKQRWIDTILFHARLVDNQVVIEEDNFEEGLSQALIAAGIKAEDIVTSPFPDNSDRQRTYQTVEGRGKKEEGRGGNWEMGRGGGFFPN